MHKFTGQQLQSYQSYLSPAIVVIIFWNFAMFQYRANSPQIKQNLISSITNLVYELSHGLPNNLRLRIIGNQKILEKSQVWLETKPKAQSPFQKSNSFNSSQKEQKNRYQSFLVLSNFTGFVYSVPNITSRIVGWNKTLDKIDIGIPSFSEKMITK